MTAWPDYAAIGGALCRLTTTHTERAASRLAHR